ncbi:E3 ubiquitin-protein ligase CHIP-like [Dioscorea cayenensis subsp. rotundata]|uniref:E3 ubiquitin-protein ligase CHIP n=1 Tax=Dioscorea cayennensis subsp. rotundata TaxID=55577 RepID=A0AB40B2I2_DIOCR|nr:E3 ubiquitin-protein ligase CHIP-like [Dioscorea cayenensis subsp. rotundata]
MATVPKSVRKQAEVLRKAGNAAFKKERFGAAIDAYTEAIVLCPDVSVYWTNRALCRMKRNDWTGVEEDCTRALELDSSSVKAHYMLGRALLIKQDTVRGIKELEKALDLGRGADPSGYMIDEIWPVLADAKYKEWEELSDRRAWKLQCLKELCNEALIEHDFLETSRTLDESGNAAARDRLSEQLELLGRVFSKAAEADKLTEIPDYLCCKITLDIFRDPVITPSGVTYERAVILEHLRKVGNFDPLTREPLERHQLAPNLAIKQAVQSFLSEHGWAYKTN